MAKKSFPLSKVYGLLEPGPVVMITTARDGNPNIMTMSWHTMMEFEPPLVGCGNTSGANVNKFEKFGLTSKPASQAGAPLIEECYANLECRVADTKMVAEYCFFILEVVKAWIDPTVKNPKTIHHLGSGSFMVAGKKIKLKSKMK
jgi:flavin reductase (DIM6/NTAB) family NADH-FMN oxidoreductase RutF